MGKSMIIHGFRRRSSLYPSDFPMISLCFPRCQGLSEGARSRLSRGAGGATFFRAEGTQAASRWEKFFDGEVLKCWSFSGNDWFKGKFTGKPHISWEDLWFPVDFPLNQSIDFQENDWSLFFFSFLFGVDGSGVWKIKGRESMGEKRFGFSMMFPNQKNTYLFYI